MRFSLLADAGAEGVGGGSPAHQRRIVLTLVDHYLPGFKAGGPLRSIESLTRNLGSELDFRIVSRDRDFGEKVPYSDVRIDVWQRRDGVPVFYVSPKHLWGGGLARLIRATPHDVLYLNSAFSPGFTVAVLLLRRLRLLPRRPTVIAARGEMSPGALAIKSRKKRAYMAIAKWAGLYRDIIWQASSTDEAAEIRAGLRAKRRSAPRVEVAPDLPSAAVVTSDFSHRPPKLAGALRVAFLSRISRKKNLDGALEMLRGISGEVFLQIFGPVEDAEYWTECQAIIRSMPPNVRVECCGPVQHEDIGRVLRAQELLLLPTRGENFGHVILEALSAGCPVLISDRTPWRGLVRLGVGWDLPLARPEAFRTALQTCVDMPSEVHAEMARAAARWAEALRTDELAADQNRCLFRGARQRTS